MGSKRIKWGNIIILLLILAAAVAAFYYKNPGFFNPKNRAVQEDKASSSTMTENKDKPQTVGFIMGLDSWIGGTPALIALERGYNKDYSLDFDVRFIPADADRIAALKSGEIQATEVSLPSFIKQYDAMKDCGVIVGITDFSRGADGIVAKSEVKDLNDMEGRKVSYVANGTGKFILNKFLRLTGLRYQDITPVEHEGMQKVVDELKSGNVDLIVSWSPDMNLAVKEMNAAKADSVKMLITTKEVPNLIPTVLVVNKNVLDEQPEKVDAFLRTWYASVKYIAERPEKAHAKLAELMNGHADEYGSVTVEDVRDSFANIKLMSLNDNFGYFGLDGKEPLLISILKDTVQTWKKYGDISDDNIDADALLSAGNIQSLEKERDPELLVAAEQDGQSGEASGNSDKEEFKKQDEISVEKNTEKVATVDIPPVFYDTGKAKVKAESLVVLDQVLDILKQFPQYYLIIDAHTDSVGSDENNLKLSKDRAEEVKKYLISKGIDINRIIARGWGEYKPVVAEEKTDEDRAKNRRTEFTLSREK